MLPDEQQTPAAPPGRLDDQVPVRVESAWGAAAAFCLWQTFGIVLSNAFVFLWTQEQSTPLGFRSWSSYPFPAPAAGPHRLLSLTFLAGAFLLALALDLVREKAPGTMTTTRADSVAELVVTERAKTKSQDAESQDADTQENRPPA